MSNGETGAGVPNPEVPVMPEQPAATVELPRGPQTESAVERSLETAPTLPVSSREKPAQTSPVLPIATPAQSPTRVKDEVTLEVEKILEDGLAPFYRSLPEEAKPMFRQKGEQAATEISNMVRSLHVQVKRVLELIYVWLKTIPGVNKFFLEQEAKIKTDRIVQLVEERKKDLS